MVGAKIKFFRTMRGLSIEELARKVNLSKAVVSRIENGERQLKTEEEIALFAQTLEIPEEFIATAQPFFVSFNNNHSNTVGFVSIPKEVLEQMSAKDELIRQLIEKLK
jgi:transcriptional regulator with XRE-family HTH domain